MINGIPSREARIIASPSFPLKSEKCHREAKARRIIQESVEIRAALRSFSIIEIIANQPERSASRQMMMVTTCDNISKASIQVLAMISG